MQFKDKVILITGAKSGIGKAAAIRFYGLGAQVVLAGRDLRGLTETAEQVGARTHVVQCDVRESAQVKNAVAESVRLFGGLDIMFSNSGLALAGALVDMSEEDFDRIIHTNLYGVFHGIKHAAPAIALRGGGSIINTASVTGLNGVAYFGGYCASKAAIINLSRSAALELRPQGIRVNCILPGVVDTPMTSAMGTGGGDLVDQRQGGLITPDEVVNIAVFLASDAAKHVTGSAYAIDNGLSASLT